MQQQTTRYELAAVGLVLCLLTLRDAAPHAKTFGATSEVLAGAAVPQTYIAQLPGLSMYFRQSM
jgi:hypothetical protein